MKKIMGAALLMWVSYGHAESQAYYTCLGENRPAAECSGEEYDRQDKRLNDAYQAAMKLTGHQELKNKQREWIKERDENCPDTHLDTAHSYDIRMRCLSSFTAQRANELEAIAKKGMPEADIDFNAAALMMYGAYIGYQNGVAAMFDAEESCWGSMGADISKAKYCIAASLSGSFVEASFARQEGRSSAPNYQPDAMRNRIVSQMTRHGFSDAETESAMDFIGRNADKVIAGLANAGMR